MSIDKLDNTDFVVNHAATLASLESITPSTAGHFRRNHFPTPYVDYARWAIAVGGAVGEPMVIGAAALSSAEPRSLPVVLECAGHRRTEHDPSTPGIRWGIGAVSSAVWTGVPLGDVLRRAGIRRGAVEVVLRGADRGHGRHPGEHAYARSLPLDKALHPDTLLAFEMNGGPIPVEHGGPVRVIVPGWYGMDSVKWLAGIHVVTRPFDGPFQAIDYRWRDPDHPTGPGNRIDELAVHSLITSPTDGERRRPGTLDVRGVAWSAGVPLAEIAIRTDFAEWQPATIVRRSGRYGMTHWHTSVVLEPGSHRLSARATDRRGAIQPATAVPNLGGYCTNAVHRITVTAETR